MGFIDSYFFSIPERKLLVGCLVFLINTISMLVRHSIAKFATIYISSFEIDIKILKHLLSSSISTIQFK